MIETNGFSLISKSSLFKDFDPQALDALRSELLKVSLKPGEILFHQGDPGDSLYFLLSGRLQGEERFPHVEELQVFELTPGACFGDLALLAGHARSAKITALETCELAQLSRQGLERLAEKYPIIIEALSKQTKPLMRRFALVQLFRELFSLNDSEVIDELQSQLEWVHLGNGEVLFNQGDSGDTMYLIVSGRLRFVVTDEKGGERMLGEASAGEYLGEFALFTGEPRTATVYAVRASELLCFKRSLFESLVERYPKLLIHLTRSIITHSLQSTKQGKYKRLPSRNIALVPVQPEVRIRTLAHDLTQALSTTRSVLFLSHDRFDDLYGLTCAAQSSLDSPLDSYITAWLNEQEQKYAMVVYEADPAGRPGRCAACIKQTAFCW